MSNTIIKVLIVDDSALIRQLLSAILSADPDIEVVGASADPYQARESIKQLNPDVITLDVEMPKMDGITFLKNLMRLRPTPVVMISTLTTEGADITLDAIEYGAVDFIPKPKVGVAQDLQLLAEDIRVKVKTAAKAKVKPKTFNADTAVPERLSTDSILPASKKPIHFNTTDKLIAIGASTGGLEAIKEVLIALPADSPAIVIAQHIPAAFSAPFALRMNNCCAVNVCEAEDNQPILSGHVYIAPGSHHLLVERSGARVLCKLNDGPPVNRHKPAVDVLFRSAASQLGHNAMGVLLTGMGNDGAQGLLEMRNNGSLTVAQDENTSVVWGMPGEAVKINAACEVLPIGKIANRLLKFNTDYTE